MIWAIQVTENSSTTRRVRRKLLTRSWPTGTSTTTRPHLFYQVWHSSNNFPCVFIDRYNIRKIRYQERTEEGILLVASPWPRAILGLELLQYILPLWQIDLTGLWMILNMNKYSANVITRLVLLAWLKPAQNTSSPCLGSFRFGVEH